MIDYKMFDPRRVDQHVRLGDLEEWTLRNIDDDEHPFHIHINDFQVMSVNGQPYGARGLQDTVFCLDMEKWLYVSPSRIFLASLSITATSCSMAMVE